MEIAISAAKASPAELTISKEHARRFLLTHLGLLPPRRFAGKQGMLDFIRRVNCIQYDPINVVGQNSHLVLQSRVRGYKRTWLDEALYQDRTVIDGFDKVMSIYPTEDWPQFGHYRKLMLKTYMEHANTVQAAKRVDAVREEIERRGALSSLDIADDERMDWWLTDSVRAVRITLDILFYGGDTVVHHRVGTRRYFDLTKRVLPAKLLKAKQVVHTQEQYLDWHVYRRMAGVGLAHMIVDMKWVGIVGWQAGNIRAAVRRLAGSGKLARVAIEGLPREEFYVRRVDLPALQAAGRASKKPKAAAFIAPLDNLMWQRRLLRMLTGFDYVWEVYIPAAKRKWGYYVLPVLYGDSFVARIDPAFDRATKTFIIQNWWWEQGVNKKDEEMLAALRDCVGAFAKYLGASGVVLGPAARKDRSLSQIIK